MRGFVFLPLMALLEWTAGQSGPGTPECALRCWENTKYVTKCSGDPSCLCSDVNYQNSVFQCIYSQCDTVHFGSALHHAIAQCFGTNDEVFFAIPPIPNRDSLRRREEEYAAGAVLYGSGSAAGYPTESANFPTQSANYPTDSVVGPYSPSLTASLPFPYFPLNSVTSTAVTPATPTESAYNAVPVSTTAAPPLPQLYTSQVSSSRRVFPLAVIFMSVAVSLAL
ncbi:hypothetical protein B2J93_9 [Marssonina coronariae]|uniref:CFEM domain-containing protein n=1 Tax=Diplocarpon coronariae TaxID=2795749 RepID=A0A218ZG70_9HELO|nr:hypothetical protein B2J93_9 [Marssonina coronariae]